MKEFYIGLMSGTSADGLDAALVCFDNNAIKLQTTLFVPYPDTLRDQVLDMAHGHNDTLHDVYQLDLKLGQFYADACQQLLHKAQLSAVSIKAIGSHGQTVRHCPNEALPFTAQLGDPNTLSQQTGITTVADFRRRDLAAGGQGAPLAPAFHAHTLHSPNENRVILNIGGMANITVLNRDKTIPVVGFDTGPGNVLLDYWYAQHQQGRYDANGAWGAKREVNQGLLENLLADGYFQQPLPKSTGREHFNPEWLKQRLTDSDLTPAEVQATLCQLSADSIGNAIQKYASETERVLVCGGGVHNTNLIQRLQQKLPEMNVESTAREGLDPDWVEAILFAWLAKRTLEGKTGNLPSVTGAQKAVILGAIYPA
ncbi:MAG: anhydro-N-acetylmuramic acid kinase [Gammaproteobacteria bacterium]|nr:anhydro-N-acetylmuramic acid kinase [Gammaproteobacteria bacterium]